MIYFCADDYGISEHSNTRIEECIENGVLNKISVFPNVDISHLKEHLLGRNVELSLHLNLIEGFPLSKKEDISLLITKNGAFKYSFIGLFFKSIFGNRRLLKKQLYSEIKAQISFWKKQVGDETPILLDSHQHTHMIPLIFKTLLDVIKDENIAVEYIRIPAEPILPYIKSPSLYCSFSLSGFIKQWLLKFLNLFNKKEFKKANIASAAFIGIMFSGHVTEDKLYKLLPLYKKHNKNIEICFHPGFLEPGEKLFNGHRPSFDKFYYSKWRKKEYSALIKYKNN